MTDLSKPSAAEVAEFHTNADTDGKKTSLHHTLGAGAMQSAPGSHIHDGGDSKQLLDGFTISGVKAGNTALASVIAALVELGANDTTT
jgi:hypothetical protein